MHDSLLKSATEIAQMIRRREVSIAEVVDLCYARIDEVNPTLNAVVALFRERAVREAAELDAMLTGGAVRGPLHGVPFTVSASFRTADGPDGGDATVVARARAAGAILLGTTNTSELLLAGKEKGTFDLVHGVTRNPYSFGSPSTGSAAGGGAIVATAASFFHIGMDYGDDVRDTVGSIRSSAAVSGIVALKPTYGRVPRTGHVIGYGGPYDSFLQVGPMARRADDLALLMQVLSGPDTSDAAMIPVPLGKPEAVDVGTLRIACYTSAGAAAATAEARSLLEQCSGYFAALGCRVTCDPPPKLEELVTIRHEFINAAGRDYFRRALAARGREHAPPDQRFDAEQMSSAEFVRYREVLDAIRSEQLAWFEQYDLVLCPASEGYTSEYNTTGWPAGTVRAGVSHAAAGLPVGIQVIAQPWRDDVVVAALAHMERNTGGWQPPAL